MDSRLSRTPVTSRRGSLFSFGPRSASVRLAIIRVLLVQMLTIGVCAMHPSRADEPAAGPDAATAPTPLQFEVARIVVRDVPAMNVLRVNLAIDVRLHNTSEKPLTVGSEQISLQVNGTEARRRATSRLTSSQKLAPDQELKFTATFDAEFAATQEPKLVLQWRQAKQKLVVDLNRELRRPDPIKTKVLGPDDRLAVVELHRPLDHLSVWMLNDEMQRLQQQGLERLVLDVKVKAAQASSFALRTTIGGWLNSLRRGQPARRFALGTRLEAPVQFEVFYLSWAGVEPARMGSAAIAGELIQSSREQAIARALRTAYNGIPVQQALSDLRHDEPGVRRAALEANIDRLTLSELKKLIEQAEGNPDLSLSLIADNLHRVPHPQMTDQLYKFAISDDAKLSAAAMKSLIQSPAQSAVPQVRVLWRRWQASPDRQRALADAILANDDHRYSEQMLAQASLLMEQFSRPANDAAGAQQEFEDPADEPRDEPTDDQPAVRSYDVPRASGADERRLRNVLQYLARHAPVQLEDLSRRRVLRIAEPGIQDSVMQQILAHRTHADGELVKAYIQQRLPKAHEDAEAADVQDALTDKQKEELTSRLGPRGGSPRSRITRELMKTVRSFPDTRYTERLLALSKSSAVSGTVRSEAFQSAVACASGRQLQTIIDEAAENTASQKNFLIRHLQQHQHPAWLDVADLCLQGEESEQSLAVSMLITGGSTEGLEKVLQLLTSLKNAAEEEGKLSAQNFRLVKKILTALAAVAYPEARRAVNRCRMSSNLSVAQEAEKIVRPAMLTFARTTPFAEKLSKVYELREQKQYEEALVVLSELLDREPFFHSGYVSRASMRMRINEHQAALNDLQRALELDPEDSTAEAIKAITLVRLGEVRAGTELADQLLSRIPNLPTTIRRDALYNAACTFARAAQEVTDSETAGQYVDRGIRLLKESVEREKGFDEVKHLLNDDDLEALHQDDRWPEIVEQVRRNEKNKPAP